MSIRNQILSLCGLLLMGCAASRNKADLATRIQAELPDGWSVEQTENQVTVTRHDPVQARLIVPGMSGREESKPTSYYFRLTRAEWISPAHYLVLKQRYANLEQEADRLYYEAKIRQIPHEPDKAPPWEFEYHPRSEEEAKAVAQYKNLYSDIQRLPDFHTEVHAYFFNQPHYQFLHESEQEECEAVLDQVLSMLHPYAKPSNDPDPESP